MWRKVEKKRLLSGILIKVEGFEKAYQYAFYIMVFYLRYILDAYSVWRSWDGIVLVIEVVHKCWDAVALCGRSTIEAVSQQSEYKQAQRHFLAKCLQLQSSVGFSTK